MDFFGGGVWCELMPRWGWCPVSFLQLPGPLTVPSQEQMSSSGNRANFVCFTEMLLVSSPHILTGSLIRSLFGRPLCQGQGTALALGQGTGVLHGIWLGHVGPRWPCCSEVSRLPLRHVPSLKTETFDLHAFGFV